MSNKEKRCWCGEPAKFVIKHVLPHVEISTYVCEEHRDKTFEAIKWKLVAEGTWTPENFTWEKLV